jgi:hypothetical protein
MAKRDVASTSRLERKESVVMLENDDALQIVKTDLANLVVSAGKDSAESAKELRGHLLYFEKLFTLYLAHRKTNSVVWNRIQPLRPENVSSSYIYMYMYMLGAKFGFGPSADFNARTSDPRSA